MLPLVSTAVTSYSLPVSPATGVAPAESWKNDTMSPTLITLFAKSTSSTEIVVEPAASSVVVKLDELITCSYAVALGHNDTPSELPHVPADLAVHSPCEP